MTKEMEEWAYYAVDAIHREVQKDEAYQEFHEAWLKLTEEYEAILAGLPEKQRDLVTEYQVCVDNLHFQEVRVAYFLGKRVGKNSENNSCNFKISML